MTKPVKFINAMAFDERGWDYPQAHIAFFNLSVFEATHYSGTEENPVYKQTSEFEEILYSANFWGSQQIKQRGRKSKPLYNLDSKKEIQEDENGEPLRTFSVDMSKPQYQQLMAQGGDPIDVLGRIIEKHYREEVAR